MQQAASLRRLYNFTLRTSYHHALHGALPYVGLTAAAVAVAHTMHATMCTKHPLSTHGAEGVWVNKTYGVGVSVGVRDL